jgi:hypothetical protein
MPTNVTWNGTSYAIPLSGELNWQALSNFLIDLGTNAAVAGEFKQSIRVATTTPVTVAAANDCTIVTDLSVAGAVAVNLPAGVDGQIYIIVDGKGDALSNNITINPNGAQTINGAASLVLNANRQAAILQYSATGTDWRVLSIFTLIGNIPINSLSGTLAINKGGTGQTAKTAAFDALSPTTTKGDLISSDGSDNIRVGVGTDGQVLTADSGETSGLTWTSPLVNPMTTTGDFIVSSDGSGTPARLAAGADSRVLAGTGAGALPAYQQIDSNDFFTSGSAADGDEFGTVTTFAPSSAGRYNNVSNADYTSLTGDGFDYVSISTGNTDRTHTLTSGDSGRLQMSKKTDSGTGKMSVTRSSTDTIDGVTTVDLTIQNEAITNLYSGNWKTIAYCPGLGSFSATFTQTGGYSQAVTITYQKHANEVTLHIPIFSGNATAAEELITTSGTLPVGLRPNATRSDYIMVSDSGTATNTSGVIRIFASGTIRIDRSNFNTTFNNTSTCGVSANCTVKYLKVT